MASPTRLRRRLALSLALSLLLTLAAGIPALADSGLLAGSRVYTDSYAAYLAARQLDANAAYDGQVKGQFFDFFDDIFDWFGDAEDDVKDTIDDITNDYNDEGISSSPYYWSGYGMNVQQLDTVTVEQLQRVFTYSGPWVRLSFHTDEVAEENWAWRLEPGLQKISQAAANAGITPRITMTLSGLSNKSDDDDYLTRGLSWQELGNRYQNLAYRLTSKVKALGYNDVIYEAWNEPDNSDSSLGIGIGTGDASFAGSLVTLLNGFANGVHSAGGTTAFASFMTINDNKYNLIKQVWESTHTGYDYFNAHIYDDDAGKTRYWAQRIEDFTADRPVIITEHGYQSHLKDATWYRRQAWALQQGFMHNGTSTLQGVMNSSTPPTTNPGPSATTKTSSGR